MTLTALVAVGVLAGLTWLERPSPRRPPVLPYVAAGLAALVKGPVGVALIAAPLALVALMQRPRPALAELGLGRGIALVAGLVLVLYLSLALLESDGPAFLVTSSAHVDEVERALGSRAHVWQATARRRLYGNIVPRPCPGAGGDESGAPVR
jgi:4-amino-4-deoxy-L-arabinose transferase-like glycosyltransferase